MMPKLYYVLIFVILLAIIFLLIYIAVDVAEIRNKTRAFDAYIDANHPRFIKILDYTASLYIDINKLIDVRDSLDAKKNFIEGLDHGKENKDAAKGNE